MTNGADWARLHPELANLQGATKPLPALKQAKPSQPLPPPRREGDTITIALPIPPRSLSPNGRAHYYAKGSVAKRFRHDAEFLTKIVSKNETWAGATIDVELWGPRRHDDDNLTAALKNARDGIADALKCNDRDFTCGTVVQHVGKQSEGKRHVVLRITRTTKGT